MKYIYPFFIIILICFVGEQKDLINSKLPLKDKTFNYLRYDDWIKYNNNYLTLKKINEGKLLIKIENQNLNYIYNGIDDIKFKLKPNGKVKFYFLINQDINLNQVMTEISQGLNDNEIKFFVAKTEKIKKKIDLSDWKSHVNSKFEGTKTDFVIYQTPIYGAYLHNTFKDQRNNNYFILNFKAKLGDTNNSRIMAWIGDSYGSHRKRTYYKLENNFKEFSYFHNGIFLFKNPKRYVGFDALLYGIDDTVHIKDLEINSINVSKNFDLKEIRRDDDISGLFDIFAIEFINMKDKNKKFNLTNFNAIN